MNFFSLPLELIEKIINFLDNINDIYILYKINPNPNIKYIFDKQKKQLLIDPINYKINDIFDNRLNAYDFIYYKDYYNIDTTINIPLNDITSNIMVGMDNNYRKFVIIKFIYNTEENIIILHQKYIFDKYIWVINNNNYNLYFSKYLTSNVLINENNVKKIKYILNNNFTYKKIETQITIV